MAHVAIVGGGIGGLYGALVLARRGHRVSVLEQDAKEPPAVAADALKSWNRPGVPQRHSLHMLACRGQRLLSELPDVYRRAKEVGANELNFRDAAPEPVEEELKLLACSRPVLEWALRSAAAGERGVTLYPGSCARGLVWNTETPIPSAEGVVLQDGGVLQADVVVDSSGRSSPGLKWLAAVGAHPEEEATDTTTILFSRYFRVRPGKNYPVGAWPLGPRIHWPFMTGRAFYQDDRRICVTFDVPPRDRELKVLRDAPGFMAAAQFFPQLREWVDPDRCEPVTDVSTMAARNRLRKYAIGKRPIALNYLAIGDTRCLTNPAWGWGMSAVMVQARALAEALERQPHDAVARALLFEEMIGGQTEAWFLGSVAQDRYRTHMWSETPITAPTEYDLLAEMFWKTVVPAAQIDMRCFWTTVRTFGFLQTFSDMLEMHDVFEHARELERSGRTPKPAGPMPTRAELLEALRARP